MRTVLVELTRLRWRRSVVILLIAAVLLPLAVAATIAWQTRPVSEADLEAARELVRTESAQPYNQRALARCESRPERFGSPAGLDTTDDAAVSAFCEQSVLPRVEWFVDRTPLRLGRVLDGGAGIGVVAILAVLLLLAGSTYVGHDWNTGSMSNQLLFESRRSRVWASKAIALALVSAVLASAVLAAFWFSLSVLEGVRDESSRTGTGAAIFSESWHGVLLVVAAALGGYAVTMLLRSTVATLGLLFVAAVVLPFLVAVSGISGSERALPQNNALAWMTGSAVFQQYQDPACSAFSGAPEDPLAAQCLITIDRGDAAAYFGGLLVLAGAVSVFSFRRRDLP